MRLGYGYPWCRLSPRSWEGSALGAPPTHWCEESAEFLLHPDAVATATRIIASKAMKALTREGTVEGSGLRVTYVIAALVGRHALPAAPPAWSPNART